MRVPAAMAVLVGIWSFASIANAQVELKNDSFMTNDPVGFQAGFVVGEIAASRFVGSASVLQLEKVQLLFGGGTATRTITLKIWSDTAGTDAPGTELFSGDFELSATDNAMQELDLLGAGMPTAVPMQFRVGIVFLTAGLPSVARDSNGIQAGKNFILAAGLGWKKSEALGVPGDWVIRAFVTGGGAVPDAGPSSGPDGGGVGGSCHGNTECASGTFCDTAQMTCTFECRTSNDCGGGTCNSLGQCIGSRGDVGCCRTDQGGYVGALLGVGVLLSIQRRRRRGAPR